MVENVEMHMFLFISVGLHQCYVMCQIWVYVDRGRITAVREPLLKRASWPVWTGETTAAEKKL